MDTKATNFMPSIIHHQRLPHDGQFSIERLFEGIRAHFPPEFVVKSVQSPNVSKGFLPRLRNLFYIRRWCADVHHIVGDSHYLAFGLPPERLVLTIHDCAPLNRLRGWKLKVLRYFWFTGPMRRAAVVTTISQTTKEELKKWVGSLADQVVVIPNCVRSEFFPSPKEFNDTRPVCLVVGTGWNKNIERVALALVGTPCCLEIVGVLNEVQHKALVATGVPFKALGQISDSELLETYRRCDFLVFASLYEGFGLPILEAQAVGRPVITSNISSMPSVGGDGACFVDPLSVDSISKAVRKLLAEPASRNVLIAKGFENVAKYRVEVIADLYAVVYRQVLNRKK